MYSLELHGLFIFGLPIWIIARIIILINRRKKGIKFNIGDEILTNLFAIYLFLLIGITILPINIGETLPYLQELSFIERCNISIVPFLDYFKYGVYLRNIMRNVIGNLVLLMPFILYICAKSEKSRDLKSSTKIAFFISLSIELTQLFMNIFGLTYIRVVHVEDLILNTLGGVIAWGIFKLMYKGKIKSMIDNIHPQLIEENQIN
ncbi:VanZ family protein [Romboutsia sp. 1001713B170131_170501_G6]|uniref:VanZ family protein n=1 Tax=Romboutsia sp. 1001713B170131_170501_G6 TaxID=2787108 RepID=UPI0018A88404|nr:VanZ family protein [Romboutsia sp. 1001713B170131_170501_G6]